MCNSEKKMDVVVTTNMPEGFDKQWVKVTLKNSQTFTPSFKDLWRTIQAIAYCEDEKYPPPAKGRRFLAEFLNDAVYEKDYDKLSKKYKIPERCD